MSARVLMVQGCTSDAGKSTVVAALCRWLVRRGVRVAPFKPQNMALNAAVTVDGGEIGRAQAVQAQAARVPAHTDFNPVLLKPNSDTGAQVIVHGHPVGNMDAVGYHAYKRVAMDAVLASHARLASTYDAIVVEGAGSPAEVNLRDRDIANMGYAEAVDCPVILVADIDRGGVFAHLVGTLAVLSASERERIVGFVINRFRGDITLLQPGLDWLERETGKPVLGVLPYLHGLTLEAEDALPRAPVVRDGARLRVAVPAFPRISNHNDFDALRAHPDIDFQFVGPGDTFPPCDLVILPGSKSTRADLAWLRGQGWDKAILRHVRYGGHVIGICGGFQMLGRFVHDPDGVEGPPGSSEGLGLLEFETAMTPEKRLRRVRGRLNDGGAAVMGYEIHCGVSSGAALRHPLAVVAPDLAGIPLWERAGERRPHERASFASSLPQGASFASSLPQGCEYDGAVSEDGRVMGSYLHGLFDHPDALAALLRKVGVDAPAPLDIDALRDASIDRLADTIDAHMDTVRLASLLGVTP